MVPLSASKILSTYAARTPSSARLQLRAIESFPSGVTHLGRYLQPHPLFVRRACGSRKWDADGHEYVDYFGGHGALLLGHNHPAVVEAVARQMERGVHYGASHEIELEWAELIRKMIPCAGRVRFTISGTEATLLALRVARAYTGKTKVLRFAAHFHGWHDQVAFGAEIPAGILNELAASVVLCEPHDIAQVRQQCHSRDDIAAVILEPTGATFGQVPCNRQFLADLREVTARRGIVLIFDEVITGFRCSPGGAQAYYGIAPDLATLAKIVAGGYPGAALVGRSDILGVLEYRDSGPSLQGPRVPHQGTYNAGPVSAAAGVATLRVIRDTDIVARACATGERLRQEMNAVCRRLGAPWCVYGECSGFHIFPGSAAPDDIYAGRVPWKKLKGATPLELLQKIRVGFLCGGVDIIGWPGGVISGVHGGEDVDRTATAFEDLLRMLREEGDLD
ncbi:MAG: aminotransferase class III-fold pyridoxal phosphate-dependent enzyme [Acidobacteria bacterium]|nr:aminotransferase class III-fold pyridoxal phosphate-dependent enzyme [Acidobacteriota bacterium]